MGEKQNYSPIEYVVAPFSGNHGNQTIAPTFNESGTSVSSYFGPLFSRRGLGFVRGGGAFLRLHLSAPSTGLRSQEGHLRTVSPCFCVTVTKRSHTFRTFRPKVARSSCDLIVPCTDLKHGGFSRTETSFLHHSQ